MNWSFNTQAIHTEKKVDESTRIVSQSISPAVAYGFTSTDEAAAVVQGKTNEIYYGRYGNPTTTALEKKVASLEKAEAALSLSSGMAAISTSLMYFLKHGDHVLVTKDIYGGTHKFLSTLASRYGIQYDFVDFTNVEEIENSIKVNTKAFYVETPANPNLTVIDIKKVSLITKKKKISLIVDNTFMTPFLQKPIELGADVVVHSATKYLNGHGDVIAGIICAPSNIIKKMRNNYMGDLGQHLSAWDAFLILRGIKTLGLRVTQHCYNALTVAKFLESHPSIKKVYYPGLETHPQYRISKKQMSDMGGIVSFEIEGGEEAAKKFINSLELIIISFSLGDPETLVQHPASMTHSSIPRNKLPDFGLSPGLIRLSLGLESVQDILADIKQALNKLL